MGILRYPLDNGQNHTIEARLLYVTYSKYENDWPSIPHAHHFAELCYIKSGRGNYLIENKSYPVGKRQFYHHQFQRDPYGKVRRRLPAGIHHSRRGRAEFFLRRRAGTHHHRLPEGSRSLPLLHGLAFKGDGRKKGRITSSSART